MNFDLGDSLNINSFINQNTYMYGSVHYDLYVLAMKVMNTDPFQKQFMCS